MICHIEGSDGEDRVEDRVPVCGEDFCDQCGDCLACYLEDPCPGGGAHMWVIYEGDES